MRAVTRIGVRMGASVVAVAAASAHAQTDAVSANGRTFSIVPTFALEETLTNNALLSSNDRRSDLVSQVTPGVRIRSTGGRFTGFLDYSLTGIAYAKHSSSNEWQNELNAAFKVEAIEK